MQKSLLVLIFGVFTSTISLHAQDKVVQSSVLDIDENNDFSSFAMLDSVVGKYNVFFTGENHLFRKSNYLLQLKMLRYLHKKAGVRHLFLEFGYSRGWLVNKYVQTGDTALYNILFDYSYEEYALLYKGIWEFNKTLDSSERVTVDGIDIERSYTTPIKVLSMMLPETNAPTEIALSVESIHALARLNDDKNNREDEGEDGSYKYKSSTNYISDRASLKKILENIKENRDLYKSFLGEIYFDFNEVIEGLESEMEREEMNATVQEYIYREQFMYEHFLQMVEKYPGEKYYAQFGRCHTSLELRDKWCGYYYYKTLATRIKNSENKHINNKVCAIATYYPESTSYEIQVAYDEKLDYLKNKAEPDKLTLFRVPGDSLINAKFNDRFQFVIISRKKVGTESVAEEKKDELELFEPVNNSFYYLFNFDYHPYGMKQVSLKRFNDAIQTLTNANFSFENIFLTTGGAFSYVNDELDFAFASFDVFKKQEYEMNDSTRISMSGSTIRAGGGIEFGPGSFFNISVFAGLGYSQLVFDLTEDSPSNPSGSIFGSYSSSVIEYRNPAILVDFGTDIRLNWKFITLGFNGGYQYDPTERKWRLDGKIDPVSPATTLSGLYFNLTTGLFLGR